jgi:hypothetical protein
MGQYKYLNVSRTDLKKEKLKVKERGVKWIVEEGGRK